MRENNVCAIIGGGAAGIFAAITLKTAWPGVSVIVLEKSRVFLAKVKVSGGGRCNVTHSCFDPHKLTQNYPRGSKELLGPFFRFQPRDTMEWFSSRGVALKTEPDGRIFPVSNKSESIISALLSEAKNKGVLLRDLQHIVAIDADEELFRIQFKEETPPLLCRFLILATGSSLEGHRYAEGLGASVVPPVPSLFTFNVPTSPLKELSGISMPDVLISLPEIGWKERGPILITHFGFSGPCVLKLSAWAARELHAKNYRTEIVVDWIPGMQVLKSNIKQISSRFPKNLWKALTAAWPEESVHHLSSKALFEMSQKLHADRYRMEGKTTHKEEFVSCGGVELSEVDFRTMESKKTPRLFFAGEILNIDGVTGGFNFQSAWTTGHLGSGCSRYRHT